MADFNFIHITDHHLGDDDRSLRLGYAVNYAFRAMLRHIATHVASQADFIISTGDLIDPPSESGHRYFIQAMGIQQDQAKAPGPLYITAEGLANYPFYVIPGNHDDRQLMRQHLFPAEPGSEWMNVAFVHKGVQFICIDWGNDPKAIAHPGTLDFLESSLHGDLPSIIISHHAVMPIGVGWLDEFLADDIDRFWQILTHPKNHLKVLGVLCGHTHLSYEKSQSGIPVLGLRSTCFTFGDGDKPNYTLESPQYRVVMVRGGMLASRFYDVPLSLTGRLDS